MLMTTTATVEGRRVEEYLGIVQGEAIMGANIFRDFFAGIRDIVGGRSGAYEDELRKAREIALREMQEQAAALGANGDRKSTRLNSSQRQYLVCRLLLEKKTKNNRE